MLRAAQNGWWMCRKRSQEPLACLYLTMRAKKKQFYHIIVYSQNTELNPSRLTTFLLSISYSYRECTLFPLSIVLRNLWSFLLSFTVFCVLQTVWEGFLVFSCFLKRHIEIVILCLFCFCFGNKVLSYIPGWHPAHDFSVSSFWVLRLQESSAMLRTEYMPCMK